MPQNVACRLCIASHLRDQMNSRPMSQPLSSYSYPGPSVALQVGPLWWRLLVASRAWIRTIMSNQEPYQTVNRRQSSQEWLQTPETVNVHPLSFFLSSTTDAPRDIGQLVVHALIAASCLSAWNRLAGQSDMRIRYCSCTWRSMSN